MGAPHADVIWKARVAALSRSIALDTSKLLYSLEQRARRLDKAGCNKMAKALREEIKILSATRGAASRLWEKYADEWQKVVGIQVNG